MRHLRAIRNVQLGIKTLILHKMRSLLTVLGVVFGVGSVIAMLSIGEGASQEAMQQLQKLGNKNILLMAVKPTEDESATVQEGFVSVYGLLYEDDARIRQSIPAVTRTVPVKEIRKNGRLGERSLELRIVGTTPEWFDLVQRNVLAGRVLSQRDFDQHSAVCVLTEHGARRLLATGHTVGQAVRIGEHHYEVIGIVQSEQVAGSIRTPDLNVDAYIPISVARERYGDLIIHSAVGSFLREQVELHQILVQIDTVEDVEPTAQAIESLLKRFHKRQDYRINVPLALLRQTEATKRRFNIVLGSIAGISLLVGGIGIMNIMLASVTERTREIGIRRAIGAKRRQIVMQFLIETVVLTTVGGLIGIGIGVMIPWAITYFAGMPTVVPLYSIILSMGISVGVGIVFGLYPAIRAARLDPITALRHE